jgi:hypothetical protein
LPTNLRMVFLPIKLLARQADSYATLRTFAIIYLFYADKFLVRQELLLSCALKKSYGRREKKTISGAETVYFSYGMIATDYPTKNTRKTVLI